MGDGSEHTAVAKIEIIAPTDVFRCAAFWTADAGSLHHGVEYRVTIGGRSRHHGRSHAVHGR